ncbi:hypothetical protein HK098_007164, partial [Nowakowskiella sp. JEL0407]
PFFDVCKIYRNTPISIRTSVNEPSKNTPSPTTQSVWHQKPPKLENSTLKTPTTPQLQRKESKGAIVKKEVAEKKEEEINTVELPLGHHRLRYSWILWYC